jgi:hypothetical protein
MGLYTFITEYQGGTTVDQVLSKDLKGAQEKWVRSLQRVAWLDKNEKDYISSDGYDDPVQIDGVHNVWYFNLIPIDDLMCINIILTKGEKIPFPVVEELPIFTIKIDEDD